MEFAPFLDPDQPALVVGLMSGTSADGVDAACCRMRREDRFRWQVLGSARVPYDDDLAAVLRDPTRIAVPELAAAHVRVGATFAAAAAAAVDAAGVTLPDVDLIGSHGQTVWHDPRGSRGGVPVTLQIGEPAEIAERTGRPVWSDFRTADVAAGGEGAPFIPYVDWLLFTDPARYRVCLNLGGIANLTLLPPGAEIGDVVAFDTGPANMVLDALAARLLGTPHDAGGRAATEGRPDPTRLAAALADPYFARSAPKSTGRETFGAEWVERHFGPLEALAADSARERLATAAAVTVESIARAIEGAAGTAPVPADAEVLVSGGGRHNAAIMGGLAERCAPRNVVTTDERGLDGEIKEAVGFAILAYESALGRSVNLPRVTGARHPVICGKLSLPPPGSARPS